VLFVTGPAERRTRHPIQTQADITAEAIKVLTHKEGKNCVNCVVEFLGPAGGALAAN
jgi:hypothetical protein